MSEEEIQKQIKETLSKLSSTKKSKASKYRRQKRADFSEKKHQEEQKKQEETRVLKVTEFVTVSELAQMMGVSANEVISTCMQLGLFVSINQRLDAETLSIVAEEFGYEVEFVSVDVQEAIREQDHDQEVPDDEDRAPIVTVMGHVDHGKTKLLDYVRKANVAEGEAGGITQHIGAYEVEHESGKKIVFLDTPGHEAFTAMRARGAKVTDVAIIVIAADDNVMPQTKEAINHAQAAGVPIVFAINKVDKTNANPDKIKQELSEMNILVEDWGGKYQSQEISAKQGSGINELLEKVLLEAELLELKGSSKKQARGTVIESSLDKGRGYVAKVLVQNGTMKVGDMVLAGAYYGKVKAMYNEFNKIIKEAGPSSPLLLLGLNGAPQAGDVFNVMRDEREVKEISAKRQQLQREQGLRTQKHITLDEIGRRIAIGDFQELNVIVKGDVDGSVEALSDSVMKLGNEEVQVNVIHKSVGAITETDVMLASASNAIIIGFQVRPSPGARKIAEAEQIDIRLYSIIYQAIEEIKAAIEGMLAPDIEEKILCNIEIRETFKITKVGTIAGCMVLDGKVTRNTRVRVIRDGIVVYTGELGSLKRFKDDVKEVAAGYECGLNIKNFNDIKVGDIIEGYEEVEVKRTL
ncbi:MAG: translation initiation factor IF-2 [Bacteroidota bacterium]|nr:translation initiation factor IF-2 [Bacteroidota bacterium]